MSVFHRETIIHLVAGGTAGTVGAVVTCPLEVVKTRLQSSTGGFHVQVPNIASPDGNGRHVTCKTMMPSHQRRKINTISSRHVNQILAISTYGMPQSKSMGLLECLRVIVQNEGPKALFKGLGPNIVGVAPSRAIYFCAYSQAKSFFNSLLTPDTALVHLVSASCAGFVACSATNPIWFVKTRLQLDFRASGERLTAGQCIRRIYRQSGILGFYKGITASYWGISETVIHFVIYEAIKAHLVSLHHSLDDDKTSKTYADFAEFMIAAAISKTFASCVAYPHEVARTRLREEGDKYQRFWQTLGLVYKEEGYRGVYRGLGTQLVRQIPNTAIMMSTYEAVVYILTTYFRSTNHFYEEPGRIIPNKA